MSTLKVNALNNGGSAIDFPSSFKLNGNAIEQGYTSSATEPTSPDTGDLWWDSANDALYQYLNGEFKQLTIADTSISWGGDRGAFWGNTSSNPQYFSIATQATATNMGSNLLYSNYYGMSSSNGTRLVTVGGFTHDDMQYITWSTFSSATSFGTVAGLTSVTQGGSGICADATYGIVHSGKSSASSTDATILYFSFDSSGNASQGGELTSGRWGGTWGTNGTYGVYAGGNSSSNVIDYITIASPSNNASDFGDLTVGRANVTGVSDSTYSVFSGGFSSAGTNTIDYVTTATTGNATDFGDLTNAPQGPAGCSNGTLGIICGGYDGGWLGTAQHITIATPSNATTVTDLSLTQFSYGNSASGSSS